MITNKTLLVALSLHLVGMSTASAAVVWQETFDNDTGSDQPYATQPAHTWQMANGNAGTVLDLSTASGNTRVGNGVGASSGLGISNGFVFDPGNTHTGRNLYYTTAGISELGITVSALESVSFWVKHGTGSATASNFRFSFVVLVDGQWYRTNQNYNDSIASVDPFAQHMITDFTQANWVAVDYTPGVTLNGNTSGTLVSLSQEGAIQGWGFYGFQDTTTPSNNNTIRFDDLAIAIIPEPSTYALAGAAGLVGLLALRRRKAK